MSYRYYALYERLIVRKQEDRETITTKVDDAYSKNRLTDTEHQDLHNLINAVYGEAE